MDSRVSKHFTDTLKANSEKVYSSFHWSDEMLLLDIIRKGDVSLIPQSVKQKKDTYDQADPLIHYSDDPQKNDLCKLMSAVTMFSRTAIQAGVPDDIAYTLCESYVFCSDKYGVDMFFDALYSFTELVGKYKMANGINHEQVNSIKSYIMTNLNSPLLIKDIAASVFLSPSRCSHIFKEATGMTIREYAEQMRIHGASMFLTNNSLSVQAISDHFCFSSPSHFAHTFKKHTGMTPLEYRKKAAGY